MQCSDCGAKIAKEATSCRRCGATVPRKPKPRVAITLSARAPSKRSKSTAASARSSEVADTPEGHAEIARLRAEIDARDASHREAQAYLAATADILKAISGSAFDLQTVLDRLIEAAAKFCGADMGILRRRTGEAYPLAATFGIKREWYERIAQHPNTPGRQSIAMRAMLEGRSAHSPDVLADAEFANTETQRLIGFRAVLATPMMRDGRSVGMLGFYKLTPGPFSDRQIARVEAFADQAVIAIENARLLEAEQTRTKELAEALKQQTATAEVLKTISRSAFNLQKVLDTLLESAVALCEADKALIRRRDGDTYHLAATHGFSAEFKSVVGAEIIVPSRDSVVGRIALTRQTVHVPDVLADPEFDRRRWVETGDFRCVIGVPLLRDGEQLGALLLHRNEAKPFSAPQIALLETFADQAVIAIENARLFEAEQARTKELQVSLKQQTATSDVLKAISRSAFDLQKVLDTLIAAAVPLAGADMGILRRREGDAYVLASTHGVKSEWRDLFERNPNTAGRGIAITRTALEGRTIQIPDVLADPEWVAPESQKVIGFRALLATPLMREGKQIGILSFIRFEPGSFSDKQIELIETFADQAVIAIENARLFEAEQTRTKELKESLEYQTAISDVLGVISRSQTGLQPVLDTIVETSARLLQADRAVIRRRHGDDFHVVAEFGHPPEVVDFLWRTPVQPGPDSITGRAAIAKATVHMQDMQTDPENSRQDIVQLTGVRSGLSAPLMREGEVIGVLVLGRLEKKPFLDREITLLESFADQAVIAIENARLFEAEQARTKELQESLEYQTATSEVLSVISRSPTQLQPVLDAIVETAGRLCEADGAGISRLKDGMIHRVSFYGFLDEHRELLSRPQTVSRDEVMGRAILDGKVAHVLDAADDPEFKWNQAQEDIGFRTLLGVPLLRDGAAIGAITIARRTVQAFTAKQIELVTTFADQAVIAIENARLFEAEQARTKELQESLEYQTATSEVLSVISRSPDKLQPVLDAIVQTAERLCEADRGQIWLLQGEHLSVAAHVDTPAELVEFYDRQSVPLARRAIHSRAITQGRTVHIADALTDPETRDSEFIRIGRVRSILSVPLMRDGRAIGVVALVRTKVRPFTDRQIDLVTTFANQAVIAISNTELFEQVQARTKELQEACSSRPRPPKCSGQSVDRHSISRPC